MLGHTCTGGQLGDARLAAAVGKAPSSVCRPRQRRDDRQLGLGQLSVAGERRDLLLTQRRERRVEQRCVLSLVAVSSDIRMLCIDWPWRTKRTTLAGASAAEPASASAAREPPPPGRSSTCVCASGTAAVHRVGRARLGSYSTAASSSTYST